MSRISILGAGAWGTALAGMLARKGTHAVMLWAHEESVVSDIASTQQNSQFLPGFDLPPSIKATHTLAEALSGAEIVVSVMPSHHCRGIFKLAAPFLDDSSLFVSATKGIENETLLRMSEVITSTVHAERGFKPRVGAVSGPSFATEVARGWPTAVTVASVDSELCSRVQSEFSDPNFRVYVSDDIVGVELGGAIKNVVAIAAGVCDGLGFGHNTIAALITRGLAETTRLSVACGARPETLAGLAGMGDLVLTCTGDLSRNRTVGKELGKGRNLKEIIDSMHGMVAEGVLTTHATLDLARKMSVEMPITEQIDALLHRGKTPRDAIRELMTRPGKSEFTAQKN